VCLVNYALLLHCLHFPHSAFYRYVGLWRHCSSSGNMWNDSGHVVWRIDQSASFRTFDSAFYFPHSAFRNSAFYPLPYEGLIPVEVMHPATLRVVGVIKLYFAIFAAFKESMTLNLTQRSFKVMHFRCSKPMYIVTTLYRPLIVGL